jgi:hypothetical protein
MWLGPLRRHRANEKKLKNLRIGWSGQLGWMRDNFAGTTDFALLSATCSEDKVVIERLLGRSSPIAVMG